VPAVEYEWSRSEVEFSADEVCTGCVAAPHVAALARFFEAESYMSHAHQCLKLNVDVLLCIIMWGHV